MDLSDLNPQQKSAVLDSFDSNTVVIAGAGSGKTKTLTKRVGYLLEDMGVLPENIMVVTFTNKAASELSHRLASICDDLSGMWIGTFHSICVRILKQYGSYIGVDTFSIMDSNETRKTIKQVLQDKGLPAEKSNINNLVSKISKYKSNLKSPKQIKTMARNNYEHEIADIYQDYQNLTWRMRNFDFDDLIVYSVLLLTRVPEVRQWFYDNVKYIMCDESQDTNAAQFSFLKIIAGVNNLFLVGDDYQSIYAFRNAKPEYILNFQSLYPDAKVIMLEQNYRSTQTIVNASNAVVRNNTVRYDKVSFSKNAVGDPILYHASANPEEEANWIAGEIAMSMSTTPLEEISVLYRTNSQSRAIEEALLKIGIPYKMIGATSFYDRKEIKDILSFVKFVANPKDESSFKRAIGSLPGIGKKTIENILELAQQQSMSLIDAVANYAGTPKQMASINVFADIVAFAPQVPSELVEDIATKSGILAALRKENTQDSLSRIDNIKELINVAIENENSNANFTINDFINNIALMSASDKSSDNGAVNLMTIHSSKGLEFQTVFIAGAEEKILPHANSKSFDEIEEERRLMYVAMSRAKSNLYITSCMSRQDGQRYVASEVSRFVGEVPNNYIMKM